MQLAGLLEEAHAASPDRRILFRDQIAPFGKQAIEAVGPWLSDPAMAAFAIRVVLRVGEQGEPVAAAKALRSARGQLAPHLQGDVDWALGSLRLLVRRIAAESASANAIASTAVPTPAKPTRRIAQERPHYPPAPGRRLSGS